VISESLAAAIFAYQVLRMAAAGELQLDEPLASLRLNGEGLIDAFSYGEYPGSRPGHLRRNGAGD
jgi:hypothetical protein